MTVLPRDNAARHIVCAALALSFAPVICLVLFSFYVLGHSLNFWFTNPVDQQVGRFEGMLGVVAAADP